MSSLPLFPLGTVLFPGASLPLQVFEPRYLQLVAHLADRAPEERLFGVLALRKGHEVGPEQLLELATVGTAATIRDITRVAGGPTGTALLLDSVGTRRFRLESSDTDTTPYHLGDVTWLDEPSVEPRDLGRAAQEVRGAYRAFASVVTGAAPEVDVADADLAYAVADIVGLPLPDRQQVLECDDPVERLTLVTRLLRREQVLVGELGLVPLRRSLLGPAAGN